jgi:hypothetical protein
MTLVRMRTPILAVEFAQRAAAPVAEGPEWARGTVGLCAGRLDRPQLMPQSLCHKHPLREAHRCLLLLELSPSPRLS